MDFTSSWKAWWCEGCNCMSLSSCSCFPDFTVFSQLNALITENLLLRLCLLNSTCNRWCWHSSECGRYRNSHTTLLTLHLPSGNMHCSASSAPVTAHHTAQISFIQCHAGWWFALHHTSATIISAFGEPISNFSFRGHKLWQLSDTHSYPAPLIKCPTWHLSTEPVFKNTAILTHLDFSKCKLFKS